MNVIVIIYISLFSFIVLVVASMVYLIYIDWLNRQFKKRVGKITTSYEAIVQSGLNTIKEGHALTASYIQTVNKHNKSQSYERVFQNVLIDYAADKDNRKLVTDYIKNFEPYVLKSLRKVRRNRSVRHVQNIFLLGEYRLRSKKILDYLLEGVHSQSIAVRFNSLSALSKHGVASYLTKALMITSDKKGYLNQKVLTDVLDSFEGDQDDLILQLMKNIERLSGVFRNLVINYFTNQKTSIPAGLLVELMKTSNDKEERIMVLKYFGVVQHPEAIDLILAATLDETWEVRAIASKTLVKYVAHLKLSPLLEVLEDENWYVRTNMASTILAYIDYHKDSQPQDFDLIKSRLTDPYAIDALEYARHLQDEPKHLKASLKEIRPWEEEDAR